MRYLIILFLLAVQLCRAQENHVLRIVTYRGDVSIDRISVHTGQLVSSSSQKLEVAKNSYVYVLTPKGYSMKFESGSYKIDGIEDLIYTQKYKARPGPYGAVHRDMPKVLEFIGIPEDQTSI